ncbi:hypothetical protein K445DRAFT_177114 [Daldinia sp. EC12]|nr:hypothetical protein K445DRAFT_177114 [Daldinia sp. EC12]
MRIKVVKASTSTVLGVYVEVCGYEYLWASPTKLVREVPAFLEIASFFSYFLLPSLPNLLLYPNTKSESIFISSRHHIASHLISSPIPLFKSNLGLHSCHKSYCELDVFFSLHTSFFFFFFFFFSVRIYA